MEQPLPARPPPRSTSVVRFLVRGVALYLLIGVAFAQATMPEQLWVCPDPTAPHGETTGNFKKSDACKATATAGDRIQHYGFGATFWLPLIVGRAFVDD